MAFSSTESSVSPNENNSSQSAKTNLTHALTNVQNEIDMYKTALKKYLKFDNYKLKLLM